MKKTKEELLKNLKWCRDYLDVGKNEKDQENQLKVLAKLCFICDELEPEKTKGYYICNIKVTKKEFEKKKRKLK